MFTAMMWNFRSRVGKGLLGLVVLTTLTGWSTGAEAVGIPLGPCNNPKAKHLSMYYMNGVATTLTETLENYLVLRNLVLSEMTSTLNTQEVCVDLGYKYNPSGTLLTDFIESGQQLNKLLTPSFLRQWFVLGAAALATASEPAIAALLLYIGSKAGDSDLIDKAVIETQSTALMTDLFACRNVLLVPHSQGNLYAHQEHDLLYNKLKNLSPPKQELQLNGLRVVGVGSPDAVEAVFNSPTGYSTRHLWNTNSFDLVMGAVTPYLASKGFTRLPSNTDWGKADDPFSFWRQHTVGHAFAGYLGADKAKSDIVANLKTQIAALPKGGCPQFQLSTYEASTATLIANVAVVRGQASVFESVGFSTQPSSGASAAIPDQDYTPLSRAVDFTANGAATDTQVNVPVTILKNPNRTSTRFVPLLLFQGSSGTPLGAKMTAVLAIPPDGGDTTCPDGNPITATAAGISETRTVTQVGSVSVRVSDDTGTASAQGAKGSATVNVTGRDFASVEYIDNFWITSTRKSGAGQATVSLQVSSSTNNGQVTASIRGTGGTATYHDPPLDTPSTDHYTFDFIYGEGGSGGSLNFSIGATGATTDGSFASGSASYSVSVVGDSDATVTWCRSTQ